MKLPSYGLSLALGIFSLSACATAPLPDTSAASAMTPEQAISAAEQANAKAASVGHEWRDTAKLLKQAKDALAKGDSQQAVKLAEQARLFGEAGVKQAEAQKSAGPRF